MASNMADKGEGNRWDLKNVAGGLIDIEFIAQTLQLLHGGAQPQALDTNTGLALDKLAAAGVLSRGDHRALLQAWQLYTALSQVIRFCVGGNLDPAKASDAGKALLCRIGDCEDFEELSSMIAVTQDKTRAIFRKLIVKAA